MRERVTVTKNPATGEVITESENPQFGYYRAEQERAVVDEVTGFIRVKMLSALIPGTLKDLNRLGWRDGQTLGGKIVVREQMLPFRKVNPERDLKIAGDTGVVCRVGEDPIYRQTFYNPSSEALDKLISHTNVDEIREAAARLADRKAEAEKEEDFKL